MWFSWVGGFLFKRLLGGAVGGFLKNNIILVGVVVVIGVGGGYVYYKYNELSKEVLNTSVQLEKLRTEYNQLVLERKQFVSTINKQNQSIQELHEKKKHLDKVLNENEELMVTLRRSHERRLQEIYREEIVNTCQGAIDWLVDYAQGRNK